MLAEKTGQDAKEIKIVMGNRGYHYGMDSDVLKKTIQQITPNSKLNLVMVLRLPGGIILN